MKCCSRVAKTLAVPSVVGSYCATRAALASRIALQSAEEKKSGSTRYPSSRKAATWTQERFEVENETGENEGVRGRTKTKNARRREERRRGKSSLSRSQQVRGNDAVRVRYKT